MLHREIDTLRDRNATLELQVIVLYRDIYVVIWKAGKNFYGPALEILVFIDYCMGESFQDYSWIQDFEADFP